MNNSIVGCFYARFQELYFQVLTLFTKAKITNPCDLMLDELVGLVYGRSGVQSEDKQPLKPYWLFLGSITGNFWATPGRDLIDSDSAWARYSIGVMLWKVASEALT